MAAQWRSCRGRATFVVALLLAAAAGAAARTRRQSEAGVQCTVTVDGESADVPCAMSEFGVVAGAEGAIAAATPAEGCDVANYGDADKAASGRVAVAVRGECSFHAKALAAEAAGAAALVVVDTEASALPVLGRVGDLPDVAIPTVVVPAMLNKVLRRAGEGAASVAITPRAWVQRPRRMRSVEVEQFSECRPADRVVALAVASAATPPAALRNLQASAAAANVPLRVVGADVPDAGWATFGLVLVDAVQALLRNGTLGERDIVVAVPADAALIVGGVEDIALAYCARERPVVVAGRRDCDGCTSEMLRDYPVAEGGPFGYGGLREGVIGQAGEVERMLLEMGFRARAGAEQATLHSYLARHAADKQAVVDSYGALFHPLNHKWGGGKKKKNKQATKAGGGGASINDFFFANGRWYSADTGVAPAVLVGNGGRELGAGLLARLAKRLAFPTDASPWALEATSTPTPTPQWVGGDVNGAALVEQQRTLLSALATEPASLSQLPSAAIGLRLDYLKPYPTPERVKDVEMPRYNPAVGFTETARVPSWPYLTGDTLRAWCTHLYDHHNEDEWRDDAFLATIEPDATIYLPARYIKTFVNEVLHKLNHTFTIVTHNSRSAVPGDRKTGAELLESPLLRAWWTVNPSREHAKLHALPMGMPNKYYPDKGNTNLLDKAREGLRTFASKKRANFVYVNFKATPTRMGIKKHFKAMAGANVVTKKHGVAYSKYTASMCNSVFAVCPPPAKEDQAADSFCAWEALACGAIPIVLADDGSDRLGAAGLYDGAPVFVAPKDGGLKAVTREALEAFAERVRADQRTRSVDMTAVFAETWVRRIAASAAPGTPLEGAAAGALGDDLTGLHRVQLLPGLLAWERSPSWMRRRSAEAHHEASSKSSAETAELSACAAAAHLRFAGNAADAHSTLRTALFGFESRRAPFGECRRKLGEAARSALAAGAPTCALQSTGICLHNQLGDLLASKGQSETALAHWRYALQGVQRLGAPSLVASAATAAEARSIESALRGKLAAFGPLSAALNASAFTSADLLGGDGDGAASTEGRTAAAVEVGADGSAQSAGGADGVQFVVAQAGGRRAHTLSSDEAAVVADLKDAAGQDAVVVGVDGNVGAGVRFTPLSAAQQNAASSAIFEDLAAGFLEGTTGADGGADERRLVEAIRAVTSLHAHMAMQDEFCAMVAAEAAAGQRLPAECGGWRAGAVLQFLSDAGASTASCARAGASAFTGSRSTAVGIKAAGASLCLYVRDAATAARVANYLVVEGGLFRPSELMQLVGARAAAGGRGSGDAASASDVVTALLLRLQEAMGEENVHFG